MFCKCDLQNTLGSIHLSLGDLDQAEAAFERLGRRKGYRLVLVEPRGINAYFLRDDVGPDIPAASAVDLHPNPTMDAQPLFSLLAGANIPLVDLDSPGEPETSAPRVNG